MPCKHENKFSVDVRVNRLEDTGAFIADIRIYCADCKTPFIFGGVDAGLSGERPMASINGQELHVPIQPKDSRIFPAVPGFTVKAH